MTPLSNMCLQICGLLVLGLGGYRVTKGYMTVSDLIASALLFYTLIGPVGQIFNVFSGIGDSLGALGRIQELLNLALESDYNVAQGTFLGKGKLINNAMVHFDKVSFGYNKLKFGADAEQCTESIILRSVTLSTVTGKRAAIVGPSGAGKSTVLQLIERFYDLDRGLIFIKGKDYRNFSRTELRELVTYVEQDAPVISGTIRENLRLGNPMATYQDCCRVFEEVNLSDGQHLGANPSVRLPKHFQWTGL